MRPHIRAAGGAGRCCEEVNKECDVEGLCKGLPKRMKLLQDTDGDRLKK